MAPFFSYSPLAVFLGEALDVLSELSLFSHEFLPEVSLEVPPEVFLDVPELFLENLGTLLLDVVIVPFISVQKTNGFGNIIFPFVKHRQICWW